MDKNKDSELRLEEFIESYIFLEEKIKTKKIKVEKMIEDIDLDLEKYKKNLSKHQNEVPICNGLTNESTLYVTVFEAKDLVPTGVLGSCDPFVSLTFEDQKEKTQLRRGTLKPAWNEEFMFQVKDPESALAIEVFDQTMVGSELIGKLNISLNDLRDQEKKTAWFNLNLDNTPGNQGSIRLKLQCILSFVSYYTEKINQLQKEKDFLTKNLETLQYYVEKMDQPFGIIYCGEIDQILKQNLLKQTDALLEQLESSRHKIYAYRKDNDVALSMKVENIFKSTLKTNNIPWSKLNNDFDKQKKQIDNYAKLEKLIKIKDDIIWELLQKKNQNNNPINLNTNSSTFTTNNRYSYVSNKNSTVGKDIVKKINEKVKRNKINLYQLLCQFNSGMEGKEIISSKDIPVAMMKIGVEVNEKDVEGLIRVLGIKDSIKVPIKELAKGIALFEE